MSIASDREGRAFDREALIEDLAISLAGFGVAPHEILRPTLEELLRGVAGEDLARFAGRLETTGGAWCFHPADPVARLVSRMAHDRVLDPSSTLSGAEALEIARSRPLLLVANHLSFADLNILDAQLARTSYRDVADSLAVVVGPKVYSRPMRRLASLCFGTLKTAQSTSRASGEARMSRREVARISADTLSSAGQLLRAHTPVAVFVEGSRSRSGGMLRTLPAIARYLDNEDLMVLPWAISGSERLVPVDDEHMTPARVDVSIGSAFPAAELVGLCGRSRRLMMDVVGLLIARLLPEAYRGVYSDRSVELVEARSIASKISSSS